MLALLLVQVPLKVGALQTPSAPRPLTSGVAVSSQSVVIEVGEDAVYRSTTLFRNTREAAGPVTIEIARESVAPIPKPMTSRFPVSATLDGKPLTLVPSPGPEVYASGPGAEERRSSLRATFPMSGRSTRVLRVTYRTALGRTAGDPDKRAVAWDTGAAGGDVSFRFAPRVVLGLPDLSPNPAAWQRSATGAYRRLPAYRRETVVKAEFYSGKIGGG